MENFLSFLISLPVVVIIGFFVVKIVKTLSEKNNKYQAREKLEREVGSRCGIVLDEKGFPVGKFKLDIGGYYFKVIYIDKVTFTEKNDKDFTGFSSMIKTIKFDKFGWGLGYDIELKNGKSIFVEYDERFTEMDDFRKLRCEGGNHEGRVQKLAEYGGTPLRKGLRLISRNGKEKCKCKYCKKIYYKEMENAPQLPILPNDINNIYIPIILDISRESNPIEVGRVKGSIRFEYAIADESLPENGIEKGAVYVSLVATLKEIRTEEYPAGRYDTEVKIGQPTSKGKLKIPNQICNEETWLLGYGFDSNLSGLLKLENNEQLVVSAKVVDCLKS